MIDLGPVLGSDGKPIADEDVLLLTLEQKPLKVKLDGLTYKVLAQRGRVPFRATQMLEAATRVANLRNLTAAGFTDEDRAPGGVLYVRDAGDEEEDAERGERLVSDPRWATFSELQANDPDILRARAGVAATAIIATNVPQLKDKDPISADDLLGAGRVGAAIIEAVGNFTSSWSLESKPAGESETGVTGGETNPTPTKANGKEK